MSAIAGAIERKARELGVWAVVGTGELLRACERGEWFMCDGLAGRGPGFTVGRSGGEWQLDGPAAGLWLLVMEAGHTIERGECTACAERGGGWEWLARSKYRTAEVYMGAAHKDMARMDSSWTLRDVIRWGEMWQVVAARPCPTCSVDGKPTGRAHTPAHEVMLTDRTAMAVLSDRLMDQGDPLGVLLALWLAGKLDERHVLGVETVSGDRMFTWAHDGPMEISDEFTVWNYAQQQGWTLDSYFPSWRRPILEANP